MKNRLAKWRRKTVRGFTLVEMLIVLLIISVLMLLFVPNLSNQKDAVREKGNKAVVKVVESQLSLYELKEGEKPSIEQLAKAGYITDDQAETYRKTKQ